MPALITWLSNAMLLKRLMRLRPSRRASVSYSWRCFWQDRRVG